MLALDARVQNIHSFAVLPRSNSELVKDALIHKGGVAVQVIRNAVSPVETEGGQRGVNI